MPPLTDHYVIVLSDSSVSHSLVIYIYIGSSNASEWVSVALLVSRPDISPICF